MSLFFSRVRCVCGFHLVPRQSNRFASHHAAREQLPLPNPSRRSSSARLAYERRFSTSDSASNKDEPVGISPELQSCILKFVTDGSLSQEESRSISNALFRSPFGRNLVSSKDTEQMNGILQSSIDSYLTQRTKRADVGREAISNPGSYIRSIVKKEVEAADDKSAVAVNANSDATAQKQASQQPQDKSSAIDREDAIGMKDLRELLRFKYIEADELNESCLHALSQHPAFDVNYALETYAKQKKRRKEKNLEAIANPSSYVMAVLR